MPSPEQPRELLDAYKNFGCQLISSAFESLELWGMVCENYNKYQKDELLDSTIPMEESEVYDLILFFCEVNGKRSGIETLIEGLELNLDADVFKQRAIPKLKLAIESVNKFRRYYSKVPWAFPPVV